MPNSDSIYDIAIIGGGPTGMFAATYARMRLAKVLLLESLDQLGGQPENLFPQKNIYDIPALLEINGHDLTEQLKKQVLSYNPDIKLGTKVELIKKNEDNHFTLTTNRGTFFSKSIIIASGIGSFTPRKLKLTSAEKFEDSAIFYTVNNPKKFIDKEVVITGGGDSAVDWALELEKFAKKVTLIHRRDQFRALEGSVSKLKQKPIEILTPFKIEALSQVNNKLALDLTEVRGEQKIRLETDYLIVNYGFISNNDFLEEWPVKLEKKNLISVNSVYETSTKGIYAIGDIATYPGKTQLIATGMGEGPIAVNHALESLYPDKKQPTHSTSLIQEFNRHNLKKN